MVIGSLSLCNIEGENVFVALRSHIATVTLRGSTLQGSTLWGSLSSIDECVEYLLQRPGARAQRHVISVHWHVVVRVQDSQCAVHGDV